MSGELGRFCKAGEAGICFITAKASSIRHRSLQSATTYSVGSRLGSSSLTRYCETTSPNTRLPPPAASPCGGSNPAPARPGSPEASASPAGLPQGLQSRDRDVIVGLARSHGYAARYFREAPLQENSWTHDGPPGSHHSYSLDSASCPLSCHGWERDFPLSCIPASHLNGSKH